MSTTVLAAIVLFSSFLSLVYGNNGDCNMDELDKYQNEPTEPLEVVCPSGYALYKVESCYDRFEELNERRKRSTGPFDRLWIWECRAVSSLRKEDCTWSDDITDDSQQPIIFQCPKNQYMAGVRSEFFDDDSFDRSWSVRCCGVENWCQKDCYLTDFVNNIDENMDQHTAGTDKDGKVVFTGFFSEYSTDASIHDRRFKFQECKFSLCGLDKIDDDCH